MTSSLFTCASLPKTPFLPLKSSGSALILFALVTGSTNRRQGSFIRVKTSSQSPIFSGFGATGGVLGKPSSCGVTEWEPAGGAVGRAFSGGGKNTWERRR